MSQLSVLKMHELFFPIYGKFPEVWNAFLVYGQGILISVYYDFWRDNGDEQIKKSFLSEIHKHYGEIRKSRLLSTKQRIKYQLFDMSPELFCRIHKLHTGGRSK